ncbi:hypothetical protein FRC12_002895 [Ceratobasidium sp. 428]|nr:hypothetical protein FRC12_002895 [Ceratobasidium sp. 428]
MPPKRLSSLFSSGNVRFSPLRAVRTFPHTLRSSCREAFTSFNEFVHQLRPAQQDVGATPGSSGASEPVLAPQHAVDPLVASPRLDAAALADLDREEEDAVDSFIVHERLEEGAVNTDCFNTTTCDLTPNVSGNTSGIASTSHRPPSSDTIPDTSSFKANTNGRNSPVVDAGTTAATATPPADDNSVISISDDSVASGGNPVEPTDHQSVLSLSSVSTISFDDEPDQPGEYLPRYGTMRFVRCPFTSCNRPPRSQWAYGLDGLFDAPNPEQCFVGDVYFSPQEGTLKYWVCVTRDAEDGEDGEIVQEWSPIEVHGLHPTTSAKLNFLVERS